MPCSRPHQCRRKIRTGHLHRANARASSACVACIGCAEAMASRQAGMRRQARGARMSISMWCSQRQATCWLLLRSPGPTLYVAAQAVQTRLTASQAVQAEPPISVHATHLPAAGSVNSGKVTVCSGGAREASGDARHRPKQQTFPGRTGVEGVPWGPALGAGFLVASQAGISETSVAVRAHASCDGIGRKGAAWLGEPCGPEVQLRSYGQRCNTDWSMPGAHAWCRQAQN